ncbi:MAG TPA: hypothetical protein VGW30_04135, partial [Gaiellaceae bacterium]|nr:hypothetical protein [Gaiellaceae bacterium]
MIQVEDVDATRRKRAAGAGSRPELHADADIVSARRSDVQPIALARGGRRRLDFDDIAAAAIASGCERRVGSA